MPYKDPEKARLAALERKHRYIARKHTERYGPSVGNMSGRHGNHATGEHNGRWQGGRVITSHGYIAVRVHPDHPHAWGAHPTVKYAYEHILVAEEHLGRPLQPNELVHHGPGGTQDNRWENLTVKTRSEHAKHHTAERGHDALGRFPPAALRVRQWPGVVLKDPSARATLARLPVLNDPIITEALEALDAVC